MMGLFSWFKKPCVQLPTLLVHPPLPEKILARTLKTHFTHEGVQAMIQAVELEAAYHQALAISDRVVANGQAGQAYHAGAAAGLLRVLKVLADIRDSK